MNSSQTAVILGSTGMVGNLLLHQILNDADYNKVRILVRKPVSLSHPKLDIQIVNFDNQQDFSQKLGTGDTLFSCIGTTQKNTGRNKDLYKKIDYYIPLRAAAIGEQNGFTTFALVSSVGASAGARAFYLKLKGELEQSLRQLNYNSLHIVRPSMILGTRAEHRFAENTLQKITKFLSNFLFGRLKKFKAIQAASIAKAMMNAAKKKQGGVFIYEYDDIIKLAGT